jgi:hypothetical protein
VSDTYSDGVSTGMGRRYPPLMAIECSQAGRRRMAGYSLDRAGGANDGDGKRLHRPDELRPLFPFTRALRRAVGVEEELPAAWAAAAL